MVSSHLPSWQSVLAVVAHPDDESFGLGAVLSAFAEGGARVSVLCLTHGEASTLHGVVGELTALRADELAAAAKVLGLSEVTLLDHPDGGLSGLDPARLDADVRRAIATAEPDGLIGFDLTGVTGHPDHASATAAAVRAAEVLDLPVLGWTLPLAVAETLRGEYSAPFDGHAEGDVDLVLPVDRTSQLQAVECHPSQAVPGSVLWRRLELLGDRELLRWLRRPPTR
jgi:N-acetylglucosamine malate deacetylase 2